MNSNPDIYEMPIPGYYSLYLIDLKRETLTPCEVKAKVASKMAEVVFGAQNYHDIMLQFMVRYVLPQYRGRFRGQTLTWVIEKRLREVERYEVPIIRKDGNGNPEPIRLVFYRSERPGCAYMGFLGDGSAG